LNTKIGLVNKKGRQNCLPDKQISYTDDQKNETNELNTPNGLWSI
jgi:hypothetical protein